MSPSRVHLRIPGALAISFSSHSCCVQRSEPVFLLLGKRRNPGANRRTTRKPLACLSAWDICGTTHTETEATHMAYPACEAVMMVHMGTEATHMAYPACEASHIAGAASEAVRAPSRSGTHVDSLKR